MKSKLIIIISSIIAVVVIIFIALMLNNKVSNKLFYKPNNYIFLLRVSPNNNENDSSLSSYLVEADTNFKMIAKQKTDYQYTNMLYEDQTIKLYSDINRKSSCFNIKTKEKKPCTMTKGDLNKIDKSEIWLSGDGMFLRDNNVRLMIKPEITFMSQNHHFFVVSGLQLK